MIFQKRAKKNSNLEFHIGNATIDIVHEYTYLGTVMGEAPVTPFFADLINFLCGIN